MTSAANLLAMYRVMQRIRQAEQRLSSLFAENRIPGFIHSSLGQEAISAGVMHALRPHDTVASNHRGHGHAIARGVDLGRFFAEIMARADGYCRGRGGSMHVADAAVGMLGANGIVAAGLPIALGSALAHQVKQADAIAVVFFGDGALGEGVLHECLNLSKLWNLPLLMVCENNGWSEFTPTVREFVTTLPRLAEAFGIGSRSVDGNDISAVFAAASELAAIARSGAPAVLEAHTVRIRGHFEGDQQRYRDPAEIKEAETTRDPIIIAEQQFISTGGAEQDLAGLRERVAEEIEAAVVYAEASAEPDFDMACRDVYGASAEAY